MNTGISFREVAVTDARLILDWRMKPRVTSFMNTDIVDNINLQKKWIEDCYDKSDYYHWIIQVNSKPIGLINLVDYDRDRRVTSWGFYIGDDENLGLGGFIPPYFYNWIFNNLNVEKIRADVFKNNVNVINLHKLHGYTFFPELNYSIFKNAEEVALVVMELNMLSWNKSRFGMFKADFPTALWSMKG